MSDIDRRARMVSMRRKQRHMAEDRSMELTALRAENTRLRAALEEIAEADPTDITTLRHIAASARQTLEGEEG